MKKIVNIILVTGAMAVLSPVFSAEPDTSAQTEVVADSAAQTEEADSSAAAVKEAPVKEEKKAAPLTTDEDKGTDWHQVIKEKISEGGIEFMSIVLVCLIIGLIIAVERVITLSLSTTNIKKFMNAVGEALQSGGKDAALELCKSSKGPVASIFAQGLKRVDEGIDGVEKAIENYGGSEMGKLEKGLSWISLFIALAPMFGFMGTVIGMISAFDSIAAAEEIQIAEVAVGIKTALLTTVAGLIVAIILQIFYNYIVSKVDSISGQMEDASNDFVNLLVETKQFKK
jgi:biopolymer transport protein ExbB